MNRYFFYLVVLFFIAGTAVQQVVYLGAAYRGSLMSLLLAFAAGTLLLAATVRMYARFPRQGLPEIANGLLPRPLAAPFLLAQTALWFVTGAVPLLYISEISKRYINPDYATNEPLALFLAVIVFLVNMPSVKLLYFLEIILIFNVPLLVLLCFKSYFSDQLSSYSMLEAASRIFEAPNYGAFSAAFMLFTGCTALSVFNRSIAPDPAKMRYLPLLSFACFLLVMTAYFIPIGMFGADGVAQVNYVWFAVADTLRMQYGFIDRVLFVVLPMNILTTLAFALTAWHVGLEHWKSVWPAPRPVWGNLSLVYLPLAAMSAFLFVLENQLGFSRIARYANYWNLWHVPNVLIVLLLLWLGGRAADRAAGGGGG